MPHYPDAGSLAGQSDYSPGAGSVSSGQRASASRGLWQRALRVFVGYGGGALLLSDCALIGPDYRAPEMTVPGAWHAAHQEGTLDKASLAQWWKQFDSALLDGLISDALEANTDISIAQAKLREARARRDMVRGASGPTITASGSAGREKTSAETGSGSTSNLYRVGFDASWEADVFGANRRNVEASEADLHTSTENFRDVRVSLIAEVASNFVELRTTERRLAIAEANLASQKETYELVHWRLMAGLVSELDEVRARADLESSRAALHSLRSAMAESRHRLAILLGRSPGELDDRLAPAGEIPVATEKMAAGIPADTLRQRPDVRKAERELAAQTARLGAAEAARYPSLSLSGTLGLESMSAGKLLDGGAMTRSVLASLTAPIFDAGYLRANVRVQDALVEQYRLRYRAAVLSALEEVENALVSVADTGRRQKDLARAVGSAGEALAMAKNRYAAGLIDFEAVLTSQRTLINLEDQLASSAGSHSLAQISLFKALGGGWTAIAENTEGKDKS